jgi:hypothetical protein
METSAKAAFVGCIFADNQLLPYSGKLLTDYPAAVVSAVALPTILKNEFSHELETQVMFEGCKFRYVP